jgi:hypothetical protein
MTTQRKLQEHEIPDFNVMVDHVMTHYALATRLPKVYQQGYYWYNVTNTDSRKLREELELVYTFTDKQIIDTVAIVSPALPWDLNIEQARTVILAWVQDPDNEDLRKAFCKENGVQTPYGWGNHAKAWAVLAGEVEFVLKPTCHKTWNFGQCIENPDTYLGVCIDQHIVHILIGDGLRGNISITAKQYKRLSKVLFHCADLLGILPSRLQAIIWCYRQYVLSGMVDSE